MTRAPRVLSVIAFATVAALSGIAPAAGGMSTAPAAGGASAREQAPTAQPTHADATVSSTRALPNGGTVEAIYDPAPGVSPKELAAKLRKRGIANVTVDRAGSVVPNLSCSYGTARAFNYPANCPMPRYTHRGFNHPQVVFLDHSGASWPVSDAVSTWNQAQGLDSSYRWYTDGCPGSNDHCVNVWSDDYGDTGTTGTTYLRLSPQGYYISWAKITLNDHYHGTAAEQRNTACHETGHALGLGHNTSTDSCLYSVQSSHRYPDSDDFTLIANNY